MFRGSDFFVVKSTPRSVTEPQNNGEKMSDETKKCVNCGQTLDFDLNGSAPNFCPVCGTKIKHSNVQEMGNTAPVPDLACEAESEQAIPPPPPLAGRWRRWAARMLDFTLESIFVGVVVVIALELAGFSLNVSSNLIPSTGSEIFFDILICFFAFLLDSLVYAIFGNTLGKWLFGVKAVMQLDKSSLTGFYYFTRNMYIYAFAFCFGAPIIPLVTFAYQQRKVYEGKPTTYDKKLQVMSITHNTSWFKTFIGIVLFIVMLCTMAYINGSEERMKREEAMRAINSQQVVNPTSPGWNQ